MSFQVSKRGRHILENRRALNEHDVDLLNDLANVHESAAQSAVIRVGIEKLRNPEKLKQSLRRIPPRPQRVKTAKAARTETERIGIGRRRGRRRGQERKREKGSERKREKKKDPETVTVTVTVTVIEILEESVETRTETERIATEAVIENAIENVIENVIEMANEVPVVVVSVIKSRASDQQRRKLPYLRPKMQ